MYHTNPKQSLSFATCLEVNCGFALNPSRGENLGVLAFSEIAANQAVKRKADGTGLTFNPPPGNASLSNGRGARHACATQHLTLLVCPPTQAGNTHHPLLMLLVRGEYGPQPHESMEPSFLLRLDRADRRRASIGRGSGFGLVTASTVAWYAISSGRDSTGCWIGATSIGSGENVG